MRCCWPDILVLTKRIFVWRVNLGNWYMSHICGHVVTQLILLPPFFISVIESKWCKIHFRKVRAKVYHAYRLVYLIETRWLWIGGTLFDLQMKGQQNKTELTKIKCIDERLILISIQKGVVSPYRHQTFSMKNIFCRRIFWCARNFWGPRRNFEVFLCRSHYCIPVEKVEIVKNLNLFQNWYSNDLINVIIFESAFFHRMHAKEESGARALSCTRARTHARTRKKSCLGCLCRTLVF